MNVWMWAVAAIGFGALTYVGGITSNFNDAIIFANGQFVQWPEGSQQ